MQALQINLIKMIRKVRKPSQIKTKTSYQTTRIDKPNVVVRKDRKPSKPDPDSVNIDEIILE
jgi:hypothetical protein